MHGCEYAFSLPNLIITVNSTSTSTWMGDRISGDSPSDEIDCN